MTETDSSEDGDRVNEAPQRAFPKAMSYGQACFIGAIIRLSDALESQRDVQPAPTPSR